MQLYVHRGYRIQTQVTSQWQAIVWAPGSSRASTQLSKATIAEGEIVSLQRAKALIDHWESQTDLQRREAATASLLVNALTKISRRR